MFFCEYDCQFGCAQAQIKYRDATGNIALRVLSQWREQTSEASRARNLSNVKVLGTYAAQSSAAYMSRGQFHKANANLDQYSRILACSNSASDRRASAAIVNDLSNLQTMNAGMLRRASAACFSTASYLLAKPPTMSMVQCAAMPPPPQPTTAAYHLPMVPPPPYPPPSPPQTVKSKAKASEGIGGFLKSLVSGPSARSASASASAAPVHLQQRGTLNTLPEGEMDSVDAPGAAAGTAPAPLEDATNEEESTAIRQTIDDRSATNVYRARKSSYI